MVPITRDTIGALIAMLATRTGSNALTWTKRAGTGCALAGMDSKVYIQVVEAVR
jgi:hypothetical protein